MLYNNDVYLNRFELKFTSSVFYIKLLLIHYYAFVLLYFSLRLTLSFIIVYILFPVFRPFLMSRRKMFCGIWRVFLAVWSSYDAAEIFGITFCVNISRWIVKNWNTSPGMMLNSLRALAVSFHYFIISAGIFILWIQWIKDEIIMRFNNFSKIELTWMCKSILITWM